MDVVMRDNEGVNVAASYWQVFFLPDSEVAEGFRICEIHVFS